MLAFPVTDLTDQHSIKLQGKNTHFASNNYGFSNCLPYSACSFPKAKLTVDMLMLTDGSLHEES